MKRSAIIASAFLATAQPAQAQTIELLHFWQKPAEQAALQVFADSFEARGGEWYDTSRATEIKLKSYAIERITGGFSPAAVQWHGGPDLEQLIALDITRPIESIAGPLDGHGLLPSIHSILQVDGGTGALPVGLHSENWAWINLEIYRHLDLSPPRDWEHFLEQAKLIEAAGYRPLAVGHSPWERMLLFTTVLLGTGGAELYQHMIDGTLEDDAESGSLRKAFEILLRLRDEATDPDHAHTIWSASTDDVIEGRAAMQVMGDWAKGEFLNSGKVLGQDFDCIPAPGNGDALTMILDVFVLPTTTDSAITAAQSALIDIVLDPENQKNFSQIKGSLPIIGDVDVDSFDRCSRLGMSILAKPGGSIPSLSLALHQDRTARIHGAIQTIWEDEAITASEAEGHFLAEYRMLESSAR